MARFLVQTAYKELEDEERIVKKLLNNNKILHEFKELTLDELDNIKEKGYIPIGTIPFVKRYLKNAYGILEENPIEIPWYLQTQEILKREYSITTCDNLPRNGKYFLKDVSELKKFSEVITADYIDMDSLFNYKPMNKYDSTLVLSKEHLYLVSSVLDIKSEYRVYVIDSKVVNICNYNGDPMLLPDINIINKIICKVMQYEKWLRSYTIDLAVGKFGTALLEIHNFTSVGLYSTLWGSDLLYAYKDGIDYLVNDNEKNKFISKNIEI